MPEPKRARAEAALDDVSDHLGVVLQRADKLLAQWSASGATVRGQVQREAAAIGDAVAGAVDTAVARATASGVDRAIADQVGGHLTALSAVIAKLQGRTRAAARADTDERRGDRLVFWGVSCSDKCVGRAKDQWGLPLENRTFLLCLDILSTFS